MATADEDYRKSRKQFFIGLLLAGMGVVLLFLVGSADVRFDLQGLQEVRGRVLHAESYKPGRHSSYQLVMTLDTGSGVVGLWQEANGYYAQFFAPGQLVRAWVNPEADAPQASHAVWQIERDGRVVMPVLDVGDRVFNRLLWDGGAALIPLLGGLFLVGRHVVRYHHDDGAGREEKKSA
jgi:hypothetical protein